MRATRGGFWLVSVVAAAVAACNDGPTATRRVVPLVPEAPSGALQPSSDIPDEYLVQMDDQMTDVAGEVRHVQSLGGRVIAQWESALKGYAVRASPTILADLRRRPGVRRIEPNRVATVTYGQNPVPSWGLDRLDQQDAVLDHRFLFPRTGAEVRIYIIDSGIRETHVDFGERASWGADFVDGTFVDCLGHGTLVAGVAGGFRYGVAKRARLVAVRVFGCSNSTSTDRIISGVDWVTANGCGPPWST